MDALPLPPDSAPTQRDEKRVPLEDTHTTTRVLLKWRRDAVMPQPGWSIDVPGVARPSLVVSADESDDPDYIVLVLLAAHAA